jgi:hypothetical protein
VGGYISSPVQLGSGAHPASYEMDASSLSVVKRQGRGLDHTTPSRAEVKERIMMCLYFFVGSSSRVAGRSLHLVERNVYVY